MSRAALSDSAKQARNEYYRNWRKQHAESVKAANRKYYLKRKKLDTEKNTIIGELTK